MLRKNIIYFFFIFLNTFSNAQQPKLVFPIGHTENILSTQFSPDGQHLYTKSGDRTVKIWNTFSGKLLADITTNNPYYDIFCVSSDGKRILRNYDDSTVTIWDAGSAIISANFKFSGQYTRIILASFSPDGKTVLAATDKDIRIWDTSTGELIREFNDFRGNCINVQYSPDSKDILAVFSKGVAKLWDITSGRPLFDINKPDNISNAQFSPDNTKIIIISDTVQPYWNSATIWDHNTGKFLNQLKHSENIKYARFSPDSKKIITISNTTDTLNVRCKMWDPNSGLLLYQLSNIKNYAIDQTSNENPLFFDAEYIDEPLSAQFNLDGKRLLTFYASSKVKLWNVENGKFLTNLSGQDDHNIISAEFSNDGKRIITITSDSLTYPEIWDAESGKKSTVLPSCANRLTLAKFTPDGKNIVTFYDNFNGKLWDIKNRSFMIDYKGHSKSVNDFQFSPDTIHILVASGNELHLWDLMSGSISTSFKGHARLINSVRINTDGKMAVSSSNDKTAKIWDLNTGQIRFDLNKHNNVVNYAEFSTDQKYILTASADGRAGLWNTIDGKNLGYCELTARDELGRTNNIRAASISKDSRRILTRSNTPIVNLWEWNGLGGKFLADLKFFNTSSFVTAIFSPDNKKIFASDERNAAFWDASTGKKMNDFNVSQNFINSAQFSPDSKKLLITYSNAEPEIFNSDNIFLHHINLIGHKSNINSCEYSLDGKKIVTASDDKTSKIWDGETGALLLDLKGHIGSVFLSRFSPDGKKVATTGADNTIRLWNVDNGSLILTFFEVDSTDYFCQIPTGYYKATLGAAKLLHYVTKDLKTITFEQLDIKYNRPDKVLEGIGNTDTTLIRSYQKAYEKRIKKLGIDTASFGDSYSIPESDFFNRDKIEHDQKSKWLHLQIISSNNKYPLDRFNVWVNEVPVYGQRGLNLKIINKNSLDTSISVTLSEGINQIETSVTDVNGTESYRIPLIVNYIPELKQKVITHFIGIGVDMFSDNKFNLQYSTKDIRDLAVKLKTKYGTNIIIDTLFNERVTVSNVNAFKRKLLQTSENDKVIIAYSGHGLFSKDFDYYLSTYAVNFDRPEEYGLPYDALEGLLDSIPARRKLLLIDACHSGEVDKEELRKIDSIASSNHLMKGIKPVVYKNENTHLGLKNSFELMQSLFVNVGKGTGAVIISAAAGTQYALERGDLKNGVFTFSILEAMDKYPTLKISELKKIVGERVEEITKGLQKPTSRNETIAVDWNIW